MGEASTRISTRERGTARVVVEAIAGLTVVGVALVGCGNKSTDIPAADAPAPSASSHDNKPADTTTMPPLPKANLAAINPNLCVVIPPEVTAAVLRVTIDSSELQAGLSSCQGLDPTAIPNEQNMIADCKIQTSPTTGVYTTVYTEAQVPKLQDAAEEYGLSEPRVEELDVNGKPGSYLPDAGLAEVEFMDGVFLNANAGPNTPAGDITTYLAQVEAAILDPQTAN